MWFASGLSYSVRLCYTNTALLYLLVLKSSLPYSVDYCSIQIGPAKIQLFLMEGAHCVGSEGVSGR